MRVRVESEKRTDFKANQTHAGENINTKVRALHHTGRSFENLHIWQPATWHTTKTNEFQEMFPRVLRPHKYSSLSLGRLSLRIHFLYLFSPRRGDWGGKGREKTTVCHKKPYLSVRTRYGRQKYR